MSVIPLIVTVSEPETGASWDYVFEAGPVVVGRGEGVQLCLDRPFVSLQHGTFAFDDAGVTYMDLDSRNGTLIDGVPRASEHPVPVSETTELRIGKLILRVSRVAPVKAVSDDRPSPFAPRPGRGPVKGTDALPRESYRPSAVRKEPPVELPVTPIVPVVVPLAAVVSTPAPPSEPGLDKTVPVPLLKSRPLPEVPVSTPVTPTYAPGGTTAVPVRPSQSRRVTPRETRPRVEREARPRRPAPPPPPRGPWLPIAIGVVVAAVAALLLLLVGGGERRARDDEEQTQPVATGGATGEATGGATGEVRRAPPEPIVDPKPPVDPPPPRPEPVRPTPNKPRPNSEPPRPTPTKSGNRSPILP